MIVLIIVLIASVLLFPLGWALFHRHRMLKRLRTKCESLGFEWKPLHKGVLFSRNLSKNYDLCIEGGGVVFWIKLWSCIHRGTTLLIDEEGRIRQGRRYRIPIAKDEQQSGERWHYARHRRVPKTVCKEPASENKETVLVLLNYPTYDRVIRRSKRQDQAVLNGSLVFGKKFYTPSAFEAELMRLALTKSRAG